MNDGKATDHTDRFADEFAGDFNENIKNELADITTLEGLQTAAFASANPDLSRCGGIERGRSGDAR